MTTIVNPNLKRWPFVRIMERCSFCEDTITGQCIRPCHCEKTYHPSCINHLAHQDERPLGLLRCDDCGVVMQYDYKTTRHQKMYHFFQWLGRNFLLIYTFTCGIATITSGVISGIDYLLSGLAYSNCIFALLCWLVILVMYCYLGLQGNKKLQVVFTLVSVILIMLLCLYPEGWLDWTCIAISGAIITRTKPFWFVLSSEYPYTQIADHPSLIAYNDI